MRRTLAASALLAAVSLSSAAFAQTPASGDFRPGPEKVLVQKNCTACHVATQVTAKRKTAEQWGETVEKMIGYGAKLSDAEFESVVGYLAKNYGPDSPK